MKLGVVLGDGVYERARSQAKISHLLRAGILYCKCRRRFSWFEVDIAIADQPPRLVMRWTALLWGWKYWGWEDVTATEHANVLGLIRLMEGALRFRDKIPELRVNNIAVWESAGILRRPSTPRA